MEQTNGRIEKGKYISNKKTLSALIRITSKRRSSSGVSSSRGPGSTSAQPMWVLWQKTWHSARLLSEHFGVFPVGINPNDASHSHFAELAPTPNNIGNWQLRYFSLAISCPTSSSTVYVRSKWRTNQPLQHNSTVHCRSYTQRYHKKTIFPGAKHLLLR
jgi:hypothetical protein